MAQTSSDDKGGARTPWSYPLATPLIFISSMFYSVVYMYRFGFFTTEALNQGKNKWLMAIMQSLGKYNLCCFASENQLQEYTSGKFREFVSRPTSDNEWPVKIVMESVGLQHINPDDATVKEMDLNPEVKVWVHV